ncbi:MAG: hypothetical protein U0987_16550 [Afipia sp.]|nr:hypothetical protein [Afipia sp.]
MAGLVPAIPIVEAPCSIDRDHRDKPGDDKGKCLRGDDIECFVSSRPSEMEPRQFAFTIFVDAIFTTLLEALFTNAFDVMACFQARACVWRARRGD